MPLALRLPHSTTSLDLEASALIAAVENYPLTTNVLGPPSPPLSRIQTRIQSFKHVTGYKDVHTEAFSKKRVTFAWLIIDVECLYNRVLKVCFVLGRPDSIQGSLKTCGPYSWSRRAAGRAGFRCHSALNRPIKAVNYSQLASPVFLGLY